MRILVCGGRDFDRGDVLERVLDEVHKNKEVTLVIQGCAKGADTLGWLWARKKGIELWSFRADWKHHGNAAGPLRNQKMIDEGKPELIVAFPTKNSRGTWDMVRRAEKAGIKTIVVKEEE